MLYIQIVEGDRGEKSQVTGAISGLSPSTASGTVITGSCQGKHCDLSVELDPLRFDLHGSLVGLSGSTTGGFEITDNPADGAATKGAVTFRPLPDSVPGLGERVKDEAVDPATLTDLMLWNGIAVPFNSDGTESMDEFRADDVASWQEKNNRPKTGVLFTADLAAMTAQRTSAQKAAGWTLFGDPAGGWRSGYPAALLPKASRVGAERQFASADGKAVLVIAIDPPLSQDDFETLEGSLHSDGDEKTGESHHNIISTNNDIDVEYTVGGQAVTKVYRNRQGGMARLVYTRPDGDNPYDDIAVEVTSSLIITSALKTHALGLGSWNEACGSILKIERSMVSG